MRWTLTIMMTLALGCGLDTSEGEELPVSVEKNALTVETCNGIDDDGDGRIDNGMLAMRWIPQLNNPHIEVGDGVAQWDQAMFQRDYVDVGDVPHASSIKDPYEKEWRDGDHTTRKITFNKEGAMLSLEWLDTDGKLTKYAYRYDSDGTSSGHTFSYCEADMSTCEYEHEVRYVKDSQGRTLLMVYDYYAGPDRTWEQRTVYEWAYRDDGQLLSRTELSAVDADGTPTGGMAYYYTYGDDALLVRVDTDRGFNGTIDEIRHTTRDDTGRVVTVSKDKGANGTVDEVMTETYDADGKLLSRASDKDADGAMEEVYTVTYNAEGNRQEATFTWLSDRTVVRQSTTTYDQNGDLVMWTHQADVDGTLELVHVRASTYDTDRRRLTHLSYSDTDKDGVFDNLENVVYTYNADGNLVALVQRKDIDGDGTSDRLSQTTYIYDFNGNLVTSLFKHEDQVDSKGHSQTTNYRFACHGE